MSKPLTVIAPDPKLHRDELYDLVGKVFSHQGYFVFRDHCRDGYVGHSHYDWPVSRAGFIDGRMVTHFGVWDYQTRVGQAAVRTGGIGAVATHGDYRGKGLMAHTARHSIEAMRQAGYDMSMLFGIENFYHKFGYTRAWSDAAYIVSTNELPKDKPAMRLRRCPLRQQDDVDAIANAQMAGLTGTAVRPTYRQVSGKGDREGYLWRDARGKVAGTLIVQDERNNPARMEYFDGCGDTQQILCACGLLARKRIQREVRFACLHHDSDLARTLRQMNCRQEIYHRPGGGAMIRIINLRSTLEKIAPVLASRLKSSVMAGFRGRLLAADGREKVVLEIGGGKVKVTSGTAAPQAISGGDELAQYIIGTDDPAQIADQYATKFTGKGRELAAALFPAQHPMLTLWDRF